MCENYYCLGKDERKIRFPLSLIKKRYKSGKVKFNKNIKNVSTEYVKEDSHINRYNVIFKKYISSSLENVLHFLGIYFLCIKLWPSNQFNKWMNKIKPDIVYCQLSSLDLIIFVDKILQLHQLKLVIHIMDDWPMTLNKSVLFKEYWDKVIEKKLNISIDIKKFNINKAYFSYCIKTITNIKNG